MPSLASRLCSVHYFFVVCIHLPSYEDARACCMNMSAGCDPGHRDRKRDRAEVSAVSRHSSTRGLSLLFSRQADNPFRPSFQHGELRASTHSQGSLSDGIKKETSPHRGRTRALGPASKIPARPPGLEGGFKGVSPRLGYRALADFLAKKFQERGRESLRSIDPACVVYSLLWSPIRTPSSSTSCVSSSEYRVPLQLPSISPADSGSPLQHQC